VREFDHELLRPNGITKNVLFVSTRRSLLVAVRAYYRLGAGEKLLAMTGDTRSVARVIGNVGKATNLPGISGWDLVTRVASSGVFFGCVQKR
jgi:hypothetical protein